MDIYRWDDIKGTRLTPEEVKQLDREVQEELDAMTLRELREASGKTQVEVAELADTTQAELSRMESRTDHRLSTLRKYVEALGGELQVIAKIGDRTVRLTNV